MVGVEVGKRGVTTFKISTTFKRAFTRERGREREREEAREVEELGGASGPTASQAHRSASSARSGDPQLSTLSISISINLSIYLSISVSLSIHISIYIYICLPTFYKGVAGPSECLQCEVEGPSTLNPKPYTLNPKL